MSKDKKLLINERDVQFYINKEKRTVVAKIVPQISVDVLDLLGEKFGCKLRNITNPSQRMGIARCNPTDKWNEYIGKRIALLKLNKHILLALFKISVQRERNASLDGDTISYYYELLKSGMYKLADKGGNNNGSQVDNDSKADAG